MRSTFFADRIPALRTHVVALALVVAGLLPNVAKADNLQGQPIYAQNNTSRTIWVAARYIPPGSSSFVADGFWRVGAGERVLILYNNGVNIYFYARDNQGGSWTGDAAIATVRGETVNMLRRDTGNGFQPWTMNFNP